MLSFTNLSLRRGTRLLIKEASFTIFRGEKTGIVGANGTGKSSLLALVLGELQPDAGNFERPSQLVLAHVSQELDATDQAAIEFIMDGDVELRATERAIAKAEAEDNGVALGNLHAQYAAIGGYDARSRAGRLMHGLGFDSADETRAVRAFSGGWRVRLNVAKALMCRSDLLLLDEPTNHLDLEMRQALAIALQDYDAAVVLVSHDRHLLRAFADELLLVHDGGVAPFDGDLDDYANWFATSAAAAVAASTEVAPPEDRKQRKREEAERRNRLSPLRAEVTRLEKSIQALERKRAEIDEQLLAPGLYTDAGSTRARELVLQQAALAKQLEAAEGAWLEAAERLERESAA